MPRKADKSQIPFGKQLRNIYIDVYFNLPLIAKIGNNLSIQQFGTA